ncbi:hypothetical protein CRYUN_Cryun07bG0167600 [Craigia yunnanensis]
MAKQDSIFFNNPSLLFLLLLLFEAIHVGRAARLNQWESGIQLPTEKDEPQDIDDQQLGTRWAVLVAGSAGYGNYRHQADVCHAYQLLRKGGLKEENIVVFMYDDIAMHELNPRPGVIINHPQGDDVYVGVPKDYTGEHVTAANLYAVLLGNKTALSGGSGKVVDSKPNDRIFLYYSDHGGPGVLEACESGSIFEGIMPKDLDVYVTTASNAQESSWGTYCPGMEPSAPPEYITCLGDLYSVAWMEDSETHNLKRETVKQQYETVRERTSNFNSYTFGGSHVMEYGNTSIKAEKLYLYQGFDPATVNFPPNVLNPDTHMEAVNQRDADILFLWHMYTNSEDRSKKTEILKQITETIRHRIHLDGGIHLIGTILYGPAKGSATLNSVREPGLPLVDDWQCLKSMVRLFETHCGSLTQYGMKHMRAFANICNSGVSQSLLEEACVAACSSHDPRQWHPSNQGFSA